MTKQCKCCLTDEPGTVHNQFIMGMCRSCSYLISGRMLRHNESVEEAIEYFEETNVLPQLRRIKNNGTKQNTH